MKLFTIILGLFFTLSTLHLNAQPTLFGITIEGGSNNRGVIFKTDINGNNYSVVYNMDVAGGYDPYGSLMLATNGKLYGTTAHGGANFLGVIFEFDPITYVYTVKYNFNSAVGSYPGSITLVQASNGKMYGTTREGGASNLGAVFEYDPVTNTAVNLVSFNGATNGKLPNGGLVLVNDTLLYGMTQYGGANDFGALFEYNLITSTFTKKMDFSSVDGNDPVGSLIQVENTKLYGVTQAGGVSNQGVLFEYDFTANTYTKKYEFTTTANGRYPLADLLLADDGKIYGTAFMGGTADKGVLFQYDITTNTYVKKLDFTGTPGVGDSPGTLMQASNGNLYGTTRYGGTGNIGTLYMYNSTADTYTEKYEFSGPDGKYPSYQGPLTEVCISSTIEIASSDTLLCVGQSAVLSASGASNYSWEIGGTGSSITVSPTDTTVYLVTGTDVNGCQNEAVFTLNVVDCADINELSETNFIKIAPNPFANELYFKSVSTQTYTVHITDVFGKTVYQKSAVFGDLAVNLEILNSGIYYIQITDSENRIFVHRVIKE